MEKGECDKTIGKTMINADGFRRSAARMAELRCRLMGYVAACWITELRRRIRGYVAAWESASWMILLRRRDRVADLEIDLFRNSP